MSRRLPEKIKTRPKQNGVNNAGYYNPFPQLMFYYKPVRPPVSPDRYDDFLKQRVL